MGRWSNQDDDIGADESDNMDEMDSFTEVTTTHFSSARVTPSANPSSRRTNNNNNGLHSPTQNKMSTRSGGGSTAVGQFSLVALVSLFLMALI